MFASSVNDLGKANVSTSYSYPRCPPNKHWFYRTTPRQKVRYLNNVMICWKMTSWNHPVRSGAVRWCWSKSCQVNTKLPCDKTCSFPSTLSRRHHRQHWQSRSPIFQCPWLGMWILAHSLKPNISQRSQQCKSAFRTCYGAFQSNRLPYCLMKAPVSFQMLMTLVLPGINWTHALVYIDEMIYSKTFAVVCTTLKTCSETE